MTSLKSRGYVREQFNWKHFYFFLTNEGIEFLREELHLPAEVVPATLKKKPGQPSGERERPAGAGRGGFRGPRKDAAGEDFKPNFEVPPPPFLFNIFYFKLFHSHPYFFLFLITCQGAAGAGRARPAAAATEAAAQ